MAELIIIRGIPGSGKSTMAKNDFPNHIHFEADMYYVDDDGNYNWDPSKIKEAHGWCQESVKKNLDQGKDVVVSNTFTRLWEMEPYFKMGASKVRVIVAKGNWESVHGVPEETIQAMRDRFEEYVEEEG